MKKETYSQPEDRIPEEAREHFNAAREEFRKSMEGMFPPGFMEHRRKARKEVLLGLRTVLDTVIGKIDEATKADETQ